MYGELYRLSRVNRIDAICTYIYIMNIYGVVAITIIDRTNENGERDKMFIGKTAAAEKRN